MLDFLTYKFVSATFLGISFVGMVLLGINTYINYRIWKG